MLRDQPEETADMKILEDMSLDVLNTETVHAYRNRHMAYRREHVWERLDDAEYLERIGAAKLSAKDKTLHPTAAGLLMFGEEYKTLYEFPEYFLDYREILDPAIRWTDRLQSSSGDWTGNLFDFFFRVYGKLVKDLKVPFKLEGITRVDDTPVHKALREAHREYGFLFSERDCDLERCRVYRNGESGEYPDRKSTDAQGRYFGSEKQSFDENV